MCKRASFWFLALFLILGSRELPQARAAIYSGGLTGAVSVAVVTDTNGVLIGSSTNLIKNNAIATTNTVAAQVTAQVTTQVGPLLLQATNFTLVTSNSLLALARASDTVTSNALVTLAYTIGANLTNLSYAIGLAGTNLSYAVGAAATNYTLAASNILSALAYTIGANSTNYANGATNGLAASATLNLFSVANSNLSYAIGLAGTNLSYAVGAASTNYTLAASNNLLTLARASDITTSNALVTLAYAIGANSTNYANGATNGLAASATLNAFSVANSNLSYAVGTASTNYTLAASNNLLTLARASDITTSNALVALAYTIGANSTNYANGATNGLAASSTVNAYSVALSNLAYAVGLAGTNYTLAASNVLSALAYTIGANATNYANGATNGLASSSTLNAFSAANSNLSYAIGLAGTNLSYAIGTASTNYTDKRQYGSAILTNLSGTGAMTNGLIAGGQMRLTTNGANQVVFAASTNLTALAAGSATLGSLSVTGQIVSGSILATPGGIGAPVITVSLDPSSRLAFVDRDPASGQTLYLYNTNQILHLYDDLSLGDVAIISQYTNYFSGPVRSDTKMLAPSMTANGSGAFGFESRLNAGVGNRYFRSVNTASGGKTWDMAIQSSDNSLQLYNATDGLIALSVSTNGVVTAPYGLTATNGLASSSTLDAFSLANSNLAYAIGTASTNYTLAASNSLSALAYAIGANSTNYANGATNGLAASSTLNAFSLANSNLSYAIGLAGTNLSYAVGSASTNYANGATNGLAASVTLNAFSVANSNLSYAIGLAGTNLSYAVGSASTNYTLAASNILSALAYTIGANGTNYTDVKSSNNVRVVVGTGPGTITTAGSSGIQTYTINFPATNGYVDQTITNGLATTAYVDAATNATVILATNIFANLSGPSQSNFISSVRLAGSNYVTASITNGFATTAYVDAATNTPLITVASNVVRQIVTQLAATNTTANTNITLNFNQGAQVLYTTNNFSITNFAGLSSTSGEKNITLRVMAQGTITVVYPTLGAPSFGVYAWTNANAPMWTTLTNGKAYIISITAQDTNLFSTITLWQ